MIIAQFEGAPSPLPFPIPSFPMPFPLLPPLPPPPLPPPERKPKEQLTPPSPPGRNPRELLSPPPPSANPTKGGNPKPSTTISPTRSGGIPVGLVAGVVVGAVALVAVLVFLLVRRRRLREEGNVGPPQQKSSPSSLSERHSKENGEKEGNITPSEGLKLFPLQSAKAPAIQELVQLPESYKIQSNTSSSSSVSTVDNTQLPLVLVGLRTFDYKELSEATSHFSQDKFLGQGGFGSVYRGVLGGGGGGGGSVAIKQLQTGSFQGECEFLTEINVISRVHHRNLVSLVGYCVSGSERLLVYEYVENNNLGFHLQGTGTPLLDWPTRMSIALGAAKGIAYLHEECHPRIIHRDIKSTNILLDSNFRAKVADFGLAKFVPDDKTHVTTRIMGTFGYLAPEFGSSGRLTEKSDVFSFGIVLLELITGRQPINLVEWASPFLDKALEDGVIENELIDPKLESNYDYEEMNQMVTCATISVHRFPDHRPKMSQIVQVLEGNISPEKLKAQTSKPRSRHRPN